MSEEEKNEGPVQLFGGTSVDISDPSAIIASMEETKDEGARNADVSYMSFSGKRGVYKIGVEGREPGPEEPFLIAITSFELGWMCWKGGKPEAKRMASISAPKIATPDKNEFGPFDEKRGEGWARARAITVRSMENGEQCYFSINSVSGVAVIADMQKEILDRMKSGQACWPAVVFGKEEFESNGYKNFKPTMEIVQWLSTEQIQTLADPEVDPLSLLDEPAEQPEAPVRRRRL